MDRDNLITIAISVFGVLIVGFLVFILIKSEIDESKEIKVIKNNNLLIEDQIKVKYNILENDVEIYPLNSDMRSFVRDLGITTDQIIEMYKKNGYELLSVYEHSYGDFKFIFKKTNN